MSDGKRFRVKLREQLEFLQRSAAAYDGGAESEAVRIGATLRILFHKSESMDPLYEHLLAKWKLFSTDGGRNDPHGFVNIILEPQHPTRPVRAVPILGNSFALEPLEIEAWWEAPVFSNKTESYSRGKLSRLLADKEGGTHVDSKLPRLYQALASGAHSLSIHKSDSDKTYFAENIHLAMVRQFAHEVLVSAKYFKWL
jgi:hypothetical protein